LRYPPILLVKTVLFLLLPVEVVGAVDGAADGAGLGTVNGLDPEAGGAGVVDAAGLAIDAEGLAGDAGAADAAGLAVDAAGLAGGASGLVGGAGAVESEVAALVDLVLCFTTMT
jgi:hypothetical protein